MLPFSYLVLGVSPTSNEANVPLTSKIRVTFAKAINPDTLNSNTVRLRKVNGDFVDYSGSYDFMQKTFVLTPDSPLDADTQYETIIQGGQQGVLAIDSSYLPETRSYSFMTVIQQSISGLSDLVLKQDYYFISAKWDLPSNILVSEEITFEVKVSLSSNPDAADVWPLNAVEGKTSSAEITIPFKAELDTNYYVHVQGETKRGKTGWLTGQIYMEPLESNNPPVEQPEDPTPTPGIGQLTLIDHSPQTDEILTPAEIVLFFDDEISPDLFNPSLEQEPLFYVVQAPYKEQLSVIDRRGTYSHKNAIGATVKVDEEDARIVVLEPIQSDSFKEGKPYTIVLSKDLVGLNTQPMGATHTIGFTAQPTHLHGSLEEIKGMIGSYAESLSNSLIQSLMKKHSQYAYDVWLNSPDYDSDLDEQGEVPYYVHQYVNTQAGIDALIASSTQSAMGRESIALGDLSISKGEGSSDGTSVRTLISSLQGQLKDWEDLIHGHHNRGYAKPGNVVKGENAGAVPDYLTRSELTQNFE